MPGASRVGVDSAGATIIGPGVPSVKVNGAPASVIGDAVVPHPPVPSPHSAGPTMVQGSSTVFIGGIGAVRVGDLASCGHPATGSNNVFFG